MHPFLPFSHRPSAHLPPGLCTYSSFCLEYPSDRPSHCWASLRSLLDCRALEFSPGTLSAVPRGQHELTLISVLSCEV